jgi:ribosomal protein S18 acetylase RimI-like enzyme
MPSFALAQPADQAEVTLRPAEPGDEPALVRLEEVSFRTDRLTRRSFHRLLRRETAACWVAMVGAALAGYVLVLYHRGTSLARLYSIAVDPAFRRRGIARRLIEAAEAAARERDFVYMRLEVRRDDAPTVALYEATGYRPFGIAKGYYEDGADAVRMEKRILATVAPHTIDVPYYRQTLDFTCGPAALMMAMHALDASVPLDPRFEFRLWREATTIFMTSGHGGCGPHGLALAAHRRGFDVEMYVSSAGPLFLHGVRSALKRRVMRLVHDDFVDAIGQSGVKVFMRPFGMDELATKLAAGGIPVVLISSYRICRTKSPHWVVVTAADERFVYTHDPEVDEETGKSETDSLNVPIRKEDFDRMARYGKTGLQAAVVLFKRTRH